MKKLTTLAMVTALVMSSAPSFAGSVGGADVEGEPVVGQNNNANTQAQGLGGLGTGAVILGAVALLAIAAAASDDNDSSSDH
ncbi:hypothetical protein [Pseudaestuariivita rosea]|uniref:hypothetical protein n=1 Tax=Pseudaestuariivita rosea TaxID=2763263 RepID=UPI001ABBA360|nr:hypothetical protein [Pseudaestuariivita rosea]